MDELVTCSFAGTQNLAQVEGFIPCVQNSVLRVYTDVCIGYFLPVYYDSNHAIFLCKELVQANQLTSSLASFVLPGVSQAEKSRECGCPSVTGIDDDSLVQCVANTC